MTPGREQVMAALFAQVTGAPSIVNFTADLTRGSTLLDNLSPAAAALFVGLPVFGPGIPPGTVIADTSPATLSLAPTASAENAALLQGFQTAGRRAKFWKNVASQPAIFVRHTTDRYPPRPTGMSEKITVHAEIWIYSRAGADPDAVPETALNYLVEAVEQTLAPTPVFNGISRQNVQTLGGLVEHCWIEGEVDFDNGDIDAQAKAVIPVAMLVPQ